jgi:hypothetical protein
MILEKDVSADQTGLHVYSRPEQTPRPAATPLKEGN